MTGEEIQTENGNWAKVHNTILERLAAVKLTGREAKCLFYLFRKTYGYGKKEDAISLSQWVEGTELYKIDVTRTLQRLEARNIIYSTTTGTGRGASTIYGFNKYYSQWREYSKEQKKGSDSTTDFSWQKGSTTATHKKGSEIAQKGSEKAEKRVASSLPTKDSKDNKLASAPLGDYLAVFRNFFEQPNSGQPSIQNFDYGKVVYWAKLVPLDAFGDAMLKTAERRPKYIWSYAEKILTDYAANGFIANGAAKEYAPQTITIIDPVTKQPKEVTV